jgi:hypothetical protein
MAAPFALMVWTGRDVEKRSHAEIVFAATVPAAIGWIMFGGIWFFDWEVRGWAAKLLSIGYFVCAFYSFMALGRLEEAIATFMSESSQQKRELVAKLLMGFNLPILLTAFDGIFGSGE